MFSVWKIVFTKIIRRIQGKLYRVCFKFVVNKYLQINSLRKILQADIKGKR